MKRTPPNLTDKLTALIVAHFGIPHEAAKRMTRDQLLGLVQWDHYPVPVALAIDAGWEPDRYNHPSNLQALLIDDHAIKTAKQDVPQIAKGDRITDEHKAFQRRMLAKAGQGEAHPETRSQWPKGRKLSSRSTWGTRSFRRTPST